MTITHSESSLEPLPSEFREGRRYALARAISIVENGRIGLDALLHHARTPGNPVLTPSVARPSS